MAPKANISKAERNITPRWILLLVSKEEYHIKIIEKYFLSENVISMILYLLKHIIRHQNFFFFSTGCYVILFFWYFRKRADLIMLWSADMGRGEHHHIFRQQRVSTDNTNLATNRSVTMIPLEKQSLLCNDGLMACYTCSWTIY